MPDWLPGVDISEAVEYVLPLLAGFVEEESVKEVFAPKLDRIMWHFFSVRLARLFEGESLSDANIFYSTVPSSNSTRDPACRRRIPPRIDPN